MKKKDFDKWGVPNNYEIAVDAIINLLCAVGIIAALAILFFWNICDGSKQETP